MGLQCLVVTRDSNLLGHIKTILDEHEASLDLRQDSTSAIELSSRRHWDGLVIDCDDVSGGGDAISVVRNSRANKQTLIFAVVNGFTSPEKALDLGANFVLSKPLQETRWRSVLEAAIPKMLREHRRYFRHEADLPVSLENHDGETFRARIKNISEGGLAIKPLDPVRLEGVINVEFRIPSIEPQLFHAKADVVWSDAFVTGLRFLYVEKVCGSALQEWLNSLEPQVKVPAESHSPQKSLS